MSLAPCRDRESRTSVRKMTAKELVQQLQQVTSTEGFQDESVPSADLLRPQKSRSSNLMERRTRLAPLQIPAPKPQAGIKHLGDGKIYDLYYWDEVLQESGDGGKVVVCKRKGDENGPNYVMKIRSKESLRENYYEEEFRKLQIRMLNFPPHVGIMPLHEVYEDENFYYTVMKKATGSFFHSLVNEFKDGVMPHRAVKSLMRDILEAVDHVHKQGMLHRDIKPDNLVMQDYDEPQSPTGTIKKVMLIDFDHADAEYSPKTPKTASSQDICGTLRFNAPETFLGEYSTGSDLYSVGTILYLLMTGRLPYDDDIFDTEPFGGALSPNSQKVFMRRIYEHMQYQPINFDCEPWPEQSDCRDFCMRMLSFDPSKRIQLADEALQHCWFSNA
jgi:serine/threonine protein kinase